MNKIFTSLLVLMLAATAKAQNPGLVISEFLPNPPSTDSPFEWVELVATQNIDFSVTPYSVVFSNNGTATTNGWIAGGTITYGFNINAGSVTAGQVVYVGGSTMVPSGTKLRVIHTGTTAGDGFGTAVSGGVLGNGGTADGIAVFNVAIGSVTNSTVPVDAIFFGNTLGSAVVNSGADGYQLPVNDRYTGGKLQSTSFIAGDPGSDVTIKAAGFFNTLTNLWSGQRGWTTQVPTYDNLSSITQGTVDPPGTATISTNVQTVAETAGTATLNVSFSGANATAAKLIVETSVHSDATYGVDYSWANDTITIPANTNGTIPFTINILDNAIAERTDHLIVKIRAVSNANVGAANYQIIYITDNDYQAPVGNNELILNTVASFSNGTEGTNSAEIVAHDPTTDRLYIANSIGKKIDIVNFSNPASPSLVTSVDITPYGNLNSLVVHNGLVAVAVENTAPQSNGFVVFFDANGTYINQVTVGAMPDMITFNNNFTKVITACEGEPNADYSIDPVGSVAIVDITPGAAALTNANVSIANFNAYIGQEAALRAQGIRIFGPGSNAAQDFEPEYITISEDNTKAFVALQENNAMAVVNLSSATVTELRPLGVQDYRTGNGLDPSDQSSGIFIGSAPVKGLYMPDAMAHSTINGTEYLFTANEGDAREYSTVLVEPVRLASANLDASIPDQNILKNNQFLGRLNITKASGDTDNDGDIDDIHTFSTRSFSIWNAQTGALVFDSKDLFEQITATHPATLGMFNASNTSGAAVAKNRSDDKGPEVEGVATAVINGNHYLFASLERVGGVMIFNVDVPSAPVFVGYYNNRSAATNNPDRGAEGIIIIKKEDSPTNKDIVILANEISSTLSVFEINTCVDLAGATFTAPTDSACSGNAILLTAAGAANSTYQWYRNNAPVAGQTSTTLSATQSGNYKLYVSNSTLACADTTMSTSITILPLPIVVANPNQSVCQGTSVTLSASGAQNYNWDNGIQQGVSFVPTTTTTYTVTGTNSYGCSNTDQVLVTVNNLPIASSTADFAICAGETTTLTATGASSVSWDNGIDNGVSFTPTETATYTAVIMDANGCTDTTETTVTVNELPEVSAGTNTVVCYGDSVELNATGATNFVWSNGADNGDEMEALNSIVLTVIGTDANGCSDDAQLSITVNPLPNVQAGNDVEACEGTLIALAATGATTLNWSNGQPNNTAALLISGTYTVTGIDANGCTNTDDLEVLVNANPSVNLGNDTVTCSNYGPVALDAGAGFANYDWNTNATTQTISAFISGTYEVTVTDNNGCSASDAIAINFDPCLGIEENVIAISVYPNPTNGVVRISSNESGFNYELQTVDGSKIQSGIATDSMVEVDLSHLANGIYILKTIQNNRETISRIVKN